MTIDLHGMNEVEVIPYVITSLLDFDNNNYEYYLEIITGKGLKILHGIVIDILKEKDRNYKENVGKIIIYKNFEINNDFDFDTFDNDYDYSEFFDEWNKLSNS